VDGQWGAGGGRLDGGGDLILGLGLDGWDGIMVLDWMERQHVVYARLESGGLFTRTGIFVYLLAEV
jgi:hypothetical protein